LWNTLKYGVPTNNWRAVVDPSNWIASIHSIVGENNSFTTQQLLSNAFQAVVYPEVTISENTNPSSNNSNSSNLIYLNI
jgi:hypothetical protein